MAARRFIRRASARMETRCRVIAARRRDAIRFVAA
jgi:hypothetical protein